MTRGFRLSAATGLHKGDRAYQQDQVAVISHPRAVGCVLGIVADGMGGRSGGRKASDQVLMTAKQLFDRYRPDRDDAGALLRQVLEDAHTVIKLTAVSSEQEPHSTIAAFLVNPSGACAWIHAGDSRIYLFRKGQMVERTRDHSYVQVLMVACAFHHLPLAYLPVPQGADGGTHTRPFVRAGADGSRRDHRARG